MRCHACHKPTPQGVYSCDECSARWAKQRAEIEAVALTLPCKSCHAEPGQPCKTGGGELRSVSHVPRETAAVKLIKKAEANKPAPLCPECNGSGEEPDGDGGITSCDACGGTGKQVA